MPTAVGSPCADLKPSNVMVGEFGQIYLVDWGLARRKAELANREAGAGLPNGTPAYMAPERARGQEYALDAPRVGSAAVPVATERFGVTSGPGARAPAGPASREGLAVGYARLV